jgi:hypothetical protein
VTAWRLGEDASARDGLGLNGDEKTALSFVGKLIEWIPADVVALYAALITALESDPAKADAKWLVGVGVALALVAVPLGAWSGRSKLSDPKLWFSRLVKKRTALAPIAFMIWSPTVPNSGWQDIKWISENLAVTTAICAILAFLFALVATGIDEGEVATSVAQP